MVSLLRGKFWGTTCATFCLNKHLFGEQPMEPRSLVKVYCDKWFGDDVGP